MNQDNFNNGQPMNNQNVGMPMGPQPMPDMGMPEVNAQPAPAMGMPEMNAQPAPDMGMTEVNAQPAPAMGMPEMNAQPAPTMGMPEMNAQPAPAMGMPEMNAQPAPTMGMPEMNSQPAPTMGMPEMNTQPAPTMGMTGMNVQPNPTMGYNNQPMYNQAPADIPQGPKKAMNLPLIIGIAVGGIAVIVLILFLTGVLGGKKLTCSMNLYDSMSQEVIINFKNDKATKVTMRLTRGGLESSEVEQAKESFESQRKELEAEGYNVKLSTTKDSVTLTMSTTKKELLDIEEDENYDTIKKDFEDQGYTCK